ncbi:MAG: cytochrome c [Algicola sp.]|nr:cytochrome c [Algicola sp.]
MEYFNNHKKLFLTALFLFVGLTLLVAIIPANKNQNNNQPLPQSKELSADEMQGKLVYIANGCVACHTQQVRNIEMDKVWGERPGIPADYARVKRTDLWRNTATLMGTERTGPDLTNIGKRQPSEAWNLLHLYQPRAVVDESVMPAYPWLFVVKSKLEPGDVEVVVPDKFRKNVTGKIVASKEALQLVAYLQSLVQTDLYAAQKSPEFLYSDAEDAEQAEINDSLASSLPNGRRLYAANCQSCHQSNGEGLPGAFPPLKGSPIVDSDNLEMYVQIIMEGYDAREEYAVMNAVGRDNNLSPAEVAAIINFERSSWGNNGNMVTKEEVEKLINELYNLQ